MLLDALSKRILILDGAMGTMIQKYSLREEDFRGAVFNTSKELKGNNECLNLTRPDVLLDIHQQYVDAGADIITANSFSANRISQAEYGLAHNAAAMAKAAAALARKVADAAPRKVWVAGTIGPTSKSLTLASDLADPSFRQYSFDEMASAFAEQITALLEGGADLILFETCFDALNVKAGLYAMAQVAPDVPVMVSASVSDASGRSLTGQTLQAFYDSVAHGNLISFGLNCSLGPEALRPMVAEVAAFSSHRISCHPNAGLPDAMGQYNEGPEQVADSLRRMAQDGLLNIAGGCCGTTPAHIAAIAKALKGIAPRHCPQASGLLSVSGLESVTIDSRRNNFLNIGERTNVAGSRKFARLIASGEFDQALAVAADQIENGASVIDVNMDDAMLDSTASMRTFLRHIANEPAVAKAALMIDSSHWETVVEGLKNAQGKCIVNSISLKEGEESFLEKAAFIKRMGAAVVVMAFDEQGQATDYERKISICQRAYNLLTQKIGFKPQDIIFDVNVLSIGTGIAEHSRYGIDFIEAVRWIKTNLPGSLTSGGISNLSFAFRGNNPVREAMHTAFLYHASAAGLDMGIVNPGMLQVYDNVPLDMLRCVEDVIFDRDEGATERLIAKAQEVVVASSGASAGVSCADTAASTSLSCAERLAAALVSGRSATLEADVLESLSELGTAVAVIEGPLMDGMKTVGDLFGQGKMFLPQVVKSAKVMRDAVAVLQPYMVSEQGSAVARPKVVIATVKGDVHDIGKNITAIVLRCNGFDVEDLGVMTPKETIIERALEIGASAVAVSGLITPSLYQMEEICRDMNSRGLDIPLFIGGATTSAVHTAVKLAPLYNHVFYGSDASSSAVLMKRCMSDRAAFEEEQHSAQAELRKLYELSQKDVSSVKSSGAGRFPADSYLPAGSLKSIPAGEVTLADVLPFFDWGMFFVTWGIKGVDEALRTDALALLHSDHIRFHIKLGLQFEDCSSDANDQIVLRSSGVELAMLRQKGEGGLSLADFVVPSSSGLSSPVGFLAIAVTAENYTHCDCPEHNTDYDSMLLRSVKVTLAEAASSWVESVLNVPEGFKIVKPASGYASCPDHSIKKEIMAQIPNSNSLGISFTETFAMLPEASICALVFVHKNACYPDIRRIGEAAVQEYASRRGLSPELARQFLGHLL